MRLHCSSEQKSAAIAFYNPTKANQKAPRELTTSCLNAQSYTIRVLWRHEEIINVWLPMKNFQVFFSLNGEHTMAEKHIIFS